MAALRNDFELGHRNAAVAAERVVREATRASEGNVGALRSQLLFALCELLAIAERRGAVDRRTASGMRATFAERLRRRHAMADVASLFPLLVREVVHVSDRPRSRAIKIRLDRARRWVEEAGPTTPVDLTRVAREVGISPSRFSRRFKEVYGTGFRQFIVSTRIERSKVLLRSTSLAAAQISAEVGWSSPAYFHQAFRRVTGMTPMTYRRRVHQV